MNSKVKVSIVVPVYNVVKYLSKCIKSILKQSFSEIEILCVDDGSDDGSLAVMEMFSAKDSRVKILRQKHQGPGAARNLALQCAKGEYILFVDADDWVEIDLVCKCVQMIHNANPDLVIFGVKTFDEKSSKLYAGQYSSRFFPNCFSVSKLFLYHTICCNKCYSRRFLIENNINFATSQTGEEQLFFLKSMLCAKRAVVIKENLYVYRKNRMGSLTSVKNKIDFSPIDNFYKIDAFIRRLEIPMDLKMKVLSRYLLKTLTWYAKIDFSIKFVYFEKLKCLLQYMQKNAGKYWWDYFELSRNAGYFSLKLQYLKALSCYFLFEKLFFIPAAFLFFMDIFMISEDEFNV